MVGPSAFAVRRFMTKSVLYRLHHWNLGQLRRRCFGLLKPKSHVHIAPQLSCHRQIVTSLIAVTCRTGELPDQSGNGQLAGQAHGPGYCHRFSVVSRSLIKLGVACFDFALLSQAFP